MKKKIMLWQVLFFLTSSFLYATTVDIIKKDKTSTYNEIDDRYKAEAGFAFYKDSNTSKKSNAKYSRNCCESMLKILNKILKEEQKQTHIQSKILKILQKRMDPQPHYIIKNGKKCIANSSADCFEMPITAAAQRVPALKTWMKNPTMANTVNFLRWEAKYFKEIFIRADSLPLAVTQFGEKAYPLNSHTIGYNSLHGFNIEKLKLKRLIEKQKKFKYIIFFGVNKDLDIASILNLRNLVEKYKKLNFTIVFKTAKSEKLFNEALNAIFSKKAKNRMKSIRMIVDPNMLKKYQIFTTPAIVVVDTKNKKGQIICNGKIEIGYFEEQVYNYLEYTKQLDYSKTIDYKNWTPDINFRENYYKNLLGIDINKILKGYKK